MINMNDIIFKFLYKTLDQFCWCCSSWNFNANMSRKY